VTSCPRTLRWLAGSRTVRRIELVDVPLLDYLDAAHTRHHDEAARVAAAVDQHRRLALDGGALTDWWCRFRIDATGDRPALVIETYQRTGFGGKPAPHNPASA